MQLESLYSLCKQPESFNVLCEYELGEGDKDSDVFSTAEYLLIHIENKSDKEDQECLIRHIYKHGGLRRFKEHLGNSEDAQERLAIMLEEGCEEDDVYVYLLTRLFEGEYLDGDTSDRSRDDTERVDAPIGRETVSVW